MLGLLLAMAFALFVSGLCSLAEATLLSLTPGDVARIGARRPRLAAVWGQFKSNIERPIAVILLINTTAHTMGASIAGAEFDALYGDEWIAAFSLVFTILMLQFTEILPKTLGVRYNRELAHVVGPPLAVLVRFLSPVLQVIYWVNRAFEGRRREDRRASALEEISSLASLARLSNQIGRHQERIIHGASRLSGRSARDVMIPLEQITFLSSDQSYQEAFITAHLEAHTRFPVSRANDPHDILGYVNFKELVYAMHTNPNDPSMRGITRPVHFAGATDSAPDLLKLFVEEHIHMAIVREGDRTVGMITLEDLVEELVGELEDEFDRLPRMIHPLSGGTWMVGGGVAAAPLFARLGLARADAQGSISAWLQEKLGGTVSPGASYGTADAEFVVRRVRRGRIFEVTIRRRQH